MVQPSGAHAAEISSATAQRFGIAPIPAPSGVPPDGPIAGVLKESAAVGFRVSWVRPYAFKRTAPSLPATAVLCYVCDGRDDVPLQQTMLEYYIYISINSIKKVFVR